MQNKKAFFINGGAGRVLASIPALEYYKNNVDKDVVIVSEGWTELFFLSKILRSNVYPVNHRNLLKDVLLDKELVTVEPYRLQEYITQQVNLVQAFSLIINGHKLSEEYASLNLKPTKLDDVLGYRLVSEVREQLKPNAPVIVFQPFGSSARQEGNLIIDELGRSFELRDAIALIDKLSAEYNVIVMSTIRIEHDFKHKIAQPNNASLLHFASIIDYADLFVGCDSVGQHMAHGLGKKSVVIFGSTYPENVGYISDPNYLVIDLGLNKRIYLPIRIHTDMFIEKHNEDLMELSEDSYNLIMETIKLKLV